MDVLMLVVDMFKEVHIIVVPPLSAFFCIKIVIIQIQILELFFPFQTAWHPPGLCFYYAQSQCEKYARVHFRTQFYVMDSCLSRHPKNKTPHTCGQTLVHILNPETKSAAPDETDAALFSMLRLLTRLRPK